MKQTKFIALQAVHMLVLGLIFFACFASARAQSVIPHLDCVDPVLQNGVPTDSIRAHFGYTNTTNAPVTINEGSNNFFTPNPSGVYSGQQTTVFQPGFNRRSFSIVLNNNANVSWIVNGKASVASGNWTLFCGNGKITYQGRLTAAGAPANQPHDFQFQFYDSLTGGTANRELFELQDVPVVNGIFSVQLDVDLVYRDYTGNAQFLEIRVRPANSSQSYSALAPRQQIGAVPFALNAKSVSGGTVQIPLNGVTPGSCTKGSDYGKLTLTNNLMICTPNGWKAVTLQ